MAVGSIFSTAEKYFFSAISAPKSPYTGCGKIIHQEKEALVYFTKIALWIIFLPLTRELIEEKTHDYKKNFY